MAEYYTELKRAVGSLDPNVADARRAVYDKARNALIGQLKAVEPPLTTAEISRQRLELEEAIRRVERETAAGVVGAAAAVPRGAPPERQLPPADQMGDAQQPSPQDVFRRAMQEAGVRGAESAARMERVPVRARADAGPLPDLHRPPRDRAPEPPYRAEPPYREPPSQGRDPAYGREQTYQREPAYEPEREYQPQERAPPRLAPDYDQDWERNAAPPPPPPGPAVDRRDRPASATRQRRRGYLEDDNQEVFERPARRSRLPGFIILVLILAMLGGVGALAWSQRAVITDLLASIDSGPTGPAVATPATPAAPVDASNKNADRIGAGGEEPAQEVRLVEPDADPAANTGDAVAPPLPGDTAGVDASGEALVAQKAILYEEPIDGGSNGVTAINASVTWKFVEDGPNGAELEANLEVPERGMKIKFSLHKNSDDTLPASHLVEVVVDTPGEFPGKGIRSVPRIVLKPTEESRGQPLVGAAAKVADGFFWIALSAAQADVQSNLGLLRERNWIDLPLVYETGQRAILTFEKGTPGERVLDRAVTAWNAG